MTSLVLALWLAQPMLDIQGDSTCPTPAEVGQHLASLVARSESGRTEQAPHAYLLAGEGSVNIELLAPDGGLLAERRLDRAAPCAELAEAVAVILAAWQAKFSPQLATAANAPPPPPARPPTVVAARPAEVDTRRPTVFDVGIAFVTSIVAGEVVAGGKVQGAAFPFAIPLGLDMSLSITSRRARSIPSPPVEAQWIRPALSLGPVLRLGGALAVDIHGNAVLALLNVRGAGLQETSSDTGLQFGFAAGLRGLWTWRHGAVWAGADLFAYPGQDRLIVGNYGEVGRLPHVEVQIALGTSLGRFR